MTNSRREDIREVGWISLGVALSYATNFLPTARTVFLIGFFAVLGIIFLIRRNHVFGLTLIAFGIGLIAPTTGVFLSAVFSIVFIVIALVMLSYHMMISSR